MTPAALIAAALLLTGQPAASTAPPPTPITVPLVVLKTRHIAVDVRINKAGPLRLVLDTGSPVTFLSNAAAAKVGLLSLEASKRPGLLGMRTPTAVKSLEIGGAHVQDLNVLILDHPTIGLLSQVDGPIDGIVGFSFFARFRTEIDYGASRVTFTPVNYVPKDVMTDLLARFSQTPPRRVVGAAGLWGFSVGAPGGERGVPVTQVAPGSAAAQGGIRKGDRITAID